MNLLAIVLTCSVHTDDMLVRAVVDNAHGNPLLIVDPNWNFEANKGTPAPDTLQAAHAELADLLAHDEDPLVGLMQVPASWAIEAGRAPAELFDPCINISIGSARISAFDFECARAGSGSLSPGWRSTLATAARRACVLTRYAQAVRLPELPTVALLNLRQTQTHDDDAASPIFSSKPTNPGWGANCVFVQPTQTGTPLTPRDSHPDSDP